MTEIGQKAEQPGMSHVALVLKSRRCVWLRDENGNKALWYLTVEGGNNGNPWTSGRHPDIEQVPDEFVDAALAKSEEKWEDTPTFEHPAVSLMQRMGLHETGKQAAERANTVAAAVPATPSVQGVGVGKSWPDQKR